VRQQIAGLALAESCVASGLGARVELSDSAPLAEELFGEGPGGFVVSGSRDALRELSRQVAVRVIGTVGGEELTIELDEGAGGATVSLALAELSSVHSEGLAEYFA
jgi:phosphoribosylformylglycinamidine synthase